jgi:hypothetical protein
MTKRFTHLTNFLSTGIVFFFTRQIYIYRQNKLSLYWSKRNHSFSKKIIFGEIKRQCLKLENDLKKKIKNDTGMESFSKVQILVISMKATKIIQKKIILF